MKIAKIFSTFLIFTLSQNDVIAQGVAAYIPTTLPISKIEKKIKDKTDLPVTAFAKYIEFNSNIDSINPSYVISTEAFSEEDESFEVISGLAANGQKTSKFILLALKPTRKDQDLSKLRIGTVEFIRRNKIKNYLEKIFSKKFKSVKTVSKPDDLFPLLVFNSVDLIAVQSYNYQELKEKFNTAVFEIGSSKEVQSLALFQKKGKGTEKNSLALKTFEYISP